LEFAMLLVTYRCPHCRLEHKRPLVTRTQFYICTNCEARKKAAAQVAALQPAPVQQELPVPAPEKKTHKNRSKKQAKPTDAFLRKEAELQDQYHER
jgi:uncharacterized Zn finger protein (UPF0148 family)